MSTASQWADYLALITAARTAAADRGSALIDAQDLLVALTLDSSSTGSTLRALGANHQNIQQAFTALETSLLATLGVSDLPARQPLPELTDFTFTERAQKFLKLAPTPQALALELINEPTGVMREALSRCGVEPNQARQALENLNSSAENSTLSAAKKQPEPSAASAHQLKSTRQIFIPAPLESVWQLTKDPLQLARWVPAIDSVDSQPVNNVWLARTTQLDQVKKFGKTRQEVLTRSIRQTQLSQTSHSYKVAYELGFPDQPRLNTQTINLTLFSQEQGTLAHVTSGWVRSPESTMPDRLGFLRRPAGLVLRPLTHWATTLQANTLAESLRRAATQRHNI